jgi:large subunit ribosomal protein L6
VSRIGKKPIIIPKEVTIKVLGNNINVKGPKGELEYSFNSNMKVELNSNELIVTRPNDLRVNKALHGLTRSLIQNMINGVTVAYSKTLEIVGVGYKAELKGKNLLLNIGYSHPIYFMPPEGINLIAPSPTQIVISGIDKQLVGMIAAKIRSIRKPEPYKGKGIKYSNEIIQRKAGKTAGK